MQLREAAQDVDKGVRSKGCGRMPGGCSQDCLARRAEAEVPHDAEEPLLRGGFGDRRCNSHATRSMSKSCRVNVAMMYDCQRTPRAPTPCGQGEHREPSRNELLPRSVHVANRRPARNDGDSPSAAPRSRSRRSCASHAPHFLECN